MCVKNTDFRALSEPTELEFLGGGLRMCILTPPRPPPQLILYTQASLGNPLVVVENIGSGNGLPGSEGGETGGSEL